VHREKRISVSVHREKRMSISAHREKRMSISAHTEKRICISAHREKRICISAHTANGIQYVYTNNVLYYQRVLLYSTVCTVHTSVRGTMVEDSILVNAFCCCGLLIRK